MENNDDHQKQQNQLKQFTINENDHHIIFIRHAQSEFNKGTLNYMEKNNYKSFQDGTTWNQLIQKSDFNTQVSYHQNYIDCHITPVGKEQCQKAKQRIKHLNVDVVLVSPQQRALQTCRQIFGDGSDLRIIVHPLLHEVFRYSCDISKQLEHKKTQFKNYDFSQVQNFAQDQNLWYLQILAEEKKKLIFKQLQQANITDYKQKQLKLLELLANNKIRQTQQQLKHRTHKIKQMIQKIANQNGSQHKKIAIVSHYHTILYTMAQDFDENHISIGENDIKNAFPYEKKLKDLINTKQKN